ncbi:MAG: diadenylate cyclase, partial [Phycisphaerales bacterium]|nr:diadenylate cyclase [Phycisphaerales bacterium]
MPPSLLSIDLLELVIELALIWAVVYFTVRFLQGTRGAGIVKGFAVLLAAFVLLQLLGLGTERFARLNFIIDYFVGLVAILLIVIFQPELRQATMRLGQARLLRSGRRYEYDARVDAIAEAVSFLSRSRFGAIIAIERNIRLGSLIEGGQPLDAKLNPSLLESIFWPNSPLHDLGVVIRGERVLAASCIRRPTPGMKVRTASHRARQAREMVMELLLADQPPREAAHDPNSHLWHWAEAVGVRESRYPA